MLIFQYAKRKIRDRGLGAFEVGHQVEHGLTELTSALFLPLFGLLHLQLALLFLQILLVEHSLELTGQSTAGTPMELIELVFLLLVVLVYYLGHGLLLGDFENGIQGAFSEPPRGSDYGGGTFEGFHRLHGAAKTSFTQTRFDRLFVFWGLI